MPVATAAAPAVNAHDAVKKVTTIATLPEVTAKIIATVEDPKSSAQALHKIVSHDPALVTRILKVVNSAFYGLPGQIGSIERAIVLLGLNAVKNIAVAASLGQLFRGAKLCEGFTAKDLWRHCVAVAVASRDIAK
ncbi:MAG TPA: HDOD domain-containing protein, partial [Humisphaera sp.]